MNSREDMPDWICSTCRRPLGTRYTESGAQFIHPVDITDGHPVRPIRPQETGGEVVTSCDFCSERAPRWVHPCNDFVLDGPLGHASSGAWAACETCHRLITARRWDKLVERSVGRLGPDPDESDYMLQVLLRTLFAEFDKRRRGTPWARW